MMASLAKSVAALGVCFLMVACRAPGRDLPLYEPAGPVPGGITPGDAAFHQALTAERARRGLRPVAVDAALTRAARAHAQDMVQQGYFAHVAPNGSTPSQRMRAVGGCRASVAENIAAGQATTMEAFQGWMTSPGHLRNMMGPHYTRYGLARHQLHYVMVLAGPCV